jgi:putative oxidoreductase
MHRLFPPFVTGPGAGGLLILRLVAGAAFILHGWHKIVHTTDSGTEFIMFNWMPPNSGVPAAMQGLAAFAEFGGGIAWIIGLLTPLASLGLVCTMLTAITTVHLAHGDPFVGPPGKPSYEPALIYFAIALTLMLLGPGVYSIDAALFGRRRTPPAPAELPPAA